MTLTPYTVEGFGGLNLVSDPLDVGPTRAVRIANFDVDTAGQARTRPGRAYFDSDDSATFSDDIIRVVAHTLPAGGTRLLVASPTKIAGYEGGSVYTASVTADARGVVDLMPYSTNLYWVQDDTGLRQWDSSSHALSSAAAGTPQGGFLALAPRSSRIVIAGARADGADDSRVCFLDPGAAAWTSDNFVDVELGFETITGAATLGDSVFVFKHTRGYEFLGEGVDADGGALFNYRAFNLGDRIRPYDAFAKGRPGRFGSDGHYIYFVASRGVYRTAGGPPELISGDITPIFRGEVSGWEGFDDSEAFVTATQDRVYVGSASASAVLVFEKASGMWTVYSFLAAAMAASTEPRSVYATTTRRLTNVSPSLTTDLGSPIDFLYTSGRYPLSDPGRVAITRETSVVGSGTVQLDVETDLYGEITGTPTVLGTAPATAEGWPFGDQEGTWFQHTLSGSGPASVSRLTHHISSVKAAGVR